MVLTVCMQVYLCTYVPVYLRYLFIYVLLMCNAGAFVLGYYELVTSSPKITIYIYKHKLTLIDVSVCL